MRAHREDGSLSVEFLAVLPLLLLMAVAGWQMLTVVSAGTVTSNAARNGSRAISTGEDPHGAILRSLPSWLAESDDPAVPGIYPAIAVDGTRVTVTVEVPKLFPGGPWSPFHVTRSAELPDTRSTS